MKKFGDVVQYFRGGEPVNALVVQSAPQWAGEQLTLVYLDPAIAGSSMAGAMVDKAIAKAFAMPLAGASKYGWKDLPSAPVAEKLSEDEAPAGPTPEQIAEHEALVKAHDAAVARVADLESQLAGAKAAEQMDQAQGKVQPGDPNSPHAI